MSGLTEPQDRISINNIYTDRERFPFLYVEIFQTWLAGCIPLGHDRSLSAYVIRI